MVKFFFEIVCRELANKFASPFLERKSEVTGMTGTAAVPMVFDDDDDMEAEAEAKEMILCYYKDIYRNQCSRIIAFGFKKHGLWFHSLKLLSYEDMVTRFRKTLVMRVTDAMVQRIIRLVNWNRWDQPLISGTVHVKIFQVCFFWHFAFEPSSEDETLTWGERRAGCLPDCHPPGQGV